MEHKTNVLIIGAGPAGLATSACLNVDEISNIVLEKEDCCASLWKQKAYDRMKLHLAKEFCKLPHNPFPHGAPTFAPKNDFVCYLDEYASTFQANPLYCRAVQCATFDVSNQNWVVVAKNNCNGTDEIYCASFLEFVIGIRKEFDVIVFATGYRSTVGKWLKDEARLFNAVGMPKKKTPDHWKGEDGLYCAGFSSSGLLGISNDAMKIVDISTNVKE